MISIRMLKICGESIIKPLELIFESCIKRGKFSIEWKKTSVVPVHTKNDKQLKEDCHPISLLPICDKISERLIYNKMFEFFTDNELISSNNPASNQETPASINCYVLLTIVINLS